jgi:UDP-N-acetyl-2-amino-2-deoxyglucuronate dehydrogenase
MNNSKKFGLIGVAGYIAPHHLKAIKETGNNLIAALDPFDSVGVMDSYFPDSAFFTEPERFDRHMDKIRRTSNGSINYVSICSPNYMHDAHIRMSLRNQADAICEKPIVLNPWNLDALNEIEKETGRNIFTILQLRHHPAIIALKEKIESEKHLDKIYDIDLTYITSRGNWYYRSWKGDIGKSGGLVTNIGVHFFDMLTWIFGSAKENIVHIKSARLAAGFLQLENAKVRWFLSVDKDDLPKSAKIKGKMTFRSISIDNEEIEFSGGFTDLHTVSYQKIIEGNGYGLENARPSIEIVHSIRNSEVIGKTGDYHPFL